MDTRHRRRQGRAAGQCPKALLKADRDNGRIVTIETTLTDRAAGA